MNGRAPWPAPARCAFAVLALAGGASAGEPWAAIPPAASAAYGNAAVTPLQPAFADGLRMTVGSAPVVQRCSLRGVGAYAVAVGLPGGVAFAFDARACRLAMAWRGGFLDLKPQWTSYGGWHPTPLGETWFATPADAPCWVRVGDRERKQPAVFRGYELVAGLPEFAYEVDRVGVRQRIAAAPGGGLRLDFAFSPGTRPLWILLPGAGATLSQIEGGERSGDVLRVATGGVRAALTIAPGAAP